MTDLDDDSIRNLCMYLANIVSVKLVSCRNLSIATFFILAKECPALSEIVLDFFSSSSVDIDYVHDMDVGRNYRIATLNFYLNLHLKDEQLRQIAVTCPNLHSLDVRYCAKLTTQGILEILNHCPRIKHLRVPKRMEVLLETFKTRHIEVFFWG